MKIEIEKSEYDRLKSREEKLMAYYEWFVDKENDLVTIEDVVNKNIELREENKKLKSDLAFERTMLDNVRAEYKSQVEINKKLEAELDEIKLHGAGKTLKKENERLKEELFEITGRRY